MPYGQGGYANILQFPDAGALPPVRKTVDSQYGGKGSAYQYNANGGGSVGTRTRTTGGGGLPNENNSEDHYGLSKPPTELQQGTPETEAVFDMYGKLWNLRKGFAKQGIDIDALDVTDPKQREAFNIWNSMNRDYQVLLNNAKEARIMQGKAQDAQLAGVMQNTGRIADGVQYNQDVLNRGFMGVMPKDIQEYNSLNAQDTKTPEEFAAKQQAYDYLTRSIASTMAAQGHQQADILAQLQKIQPPANVGATYAQGMTKTAAEIEAIKALERQRKAGARADDAQAGLYNAKALNLKNGGSGNDPIAAYRNAARTFVSSPDGKAFTTQMFTNNNAPVIANGGVVYGNTDDKGNPSDATANKYTPSQAWEVAIPTRNGGLIEKMTAYTRNVNGRPTKFYAMIESKRDQYGMPIQKIHEVPAETYSNKAWVEAPLEDVLYDFGLKAGIVEPSKEVGDMGGFDPLDARRPQTSGGSGFDYGGGAAATGKKDGGRGL